MGATERHNNWAVNTAQQINGTFIALAFHALGLKRVAGFNVEGKTAGEATRAAKRRIDSGPT